jgi:hypothetical protein
MTTPDETELLTLLVGSCAEVIQTVSQILLHGYDDEHPSKDLSNRDDLNVKLGRVLAMQRLLERQGNLNSAVIHALAEVELDQLKLLHNGDLL